MIIRDIHIYGFGKLSDTRISLESGFNLIEGKNEAGKSTLMAFIRAMLFGFESRRNLHLRYEPLNGGKMGGAINLVDEKGLIYRVERVFLQKAAGDVKIEHPDGKTLGEEFLQELLGKMNEKVYKQIYSFGLSELQQMDSLHDDQINDFLYHAGTGSVQQILKLKQYLENKQEQLFKPGGKNPEINGMITKIEDINQSIQRLKLKNNDHQKIMNDMARIEIEIDELEKKAEEDKNRIHRLEKMEQYLPVYQRLRQIDLQIAAYPAPFTFPQNGIDRMKSHLEKIDELKVEHEKLVQAKQETEQEMLNFPIHPFYEENSHEIIYQRERFNPYQEMQRKHQNLSLEIEHLQAQIEEQLERLGSTFNEENLLQMDLTMLDKQFLQELLTRIETQEKSLDKVNREIDMKKNRKGVLEKKADSMIKEKPIYSQSDEFEDRYQDIQNELKFLKEREWKIHLLDEQKKRYDQPLKASATENNLIIYLLIGLFFMTGIILFFFHLWIYGGIVLAFALILYFSIFMLKKRSEIQWEKALNLQRKQLDFQIGELNREIAAGKEKTRERIKYFGLDEVNDQTQKKLEELKKIQDDKMKDNRDRENRIKEYKRELELLEEEINALVINEQTPLIKELTSLREERIRWLSNHNLPVHLSSLILFDTLSLIQTTKDWIKKRNLMKSQMDHLSEEMTEYEERVKKLFHKNEKEFFGSIEEMVYRLSDGLLKVQNARINRGHLDKRLSEMNRQIEGIRIRKNMEEQKITELFKFAKAANQEEFYSLAAMYQEFQQLVHEKEQLLYTLQTGSNKELDFQQLLTRLEEWDKKEKETEIEEGKTEIELSKQRIKKMAEEKGQLQNQIAEMEQDETLSNLYQEYEKLQAELKEKVKEWLSVQLARQSLDQTMKIYEIEKQPQVMKRSSDFFQLLTGGQYQKVIAPIGSRKLEVISSDGQRLMPQYLSRGTVEQLYLALRFALVEEFSKQTLLPLMLDDIFVNFDLERLTNAIGALQTISKNHQIILFTCHHHVTEKVLQLFDKANHIVFN